MFDLPVYSLFYADSFLGILGGSQEQNTPGLLYIYGKQAGGYVGL